MAKPKSEILTITEVAEYIKFAERTFYRLAATKKIPAFKVRGYLAFSTRRH
jgi:excisionase family DNA binding protein